MKQNPTKFDALWRLMRADKPIGTYLLLWPTSWGLWIAAMATPSLHVLFVFGVGVFLMRSAGCVINDYADRNFDGSVERTNQRPLVTGEVTEKEALLLFAVLVIVSFLLVLTLDWKTIMLSVAALALASAYPFMKRFTYLPQFVLGAAFSWSIIMGFMAIQGTIPWWAWAIYLSNLLWTVAYDTMYAMVDREDDLKVGIKSTAILFGQYDKAIIILLQLAMLALLYLVYQHLQLGLVAHLSLITVCFLFAYQHRLIANRERAQCFKAFLHNHYVGMVIAVGLVIELSLLPLVS